jgi:hypothetical protein
VRFGKGLSSFETSSCFVEEQQLHRSSMHWTYTNNLYLAVISVVVVLLWLLSLDRIKATKVVGLCGFLVCT